MLITTEEEDERKPKNYDLNPYQDISDLVDNHSQADPKLKSTLSYTKISARAVREALISSKGYTEKELPTRQTIGDILNRMGYRLKKHKK